MHWRRNLFAVTAATFIGFTGFTLVMPFLPLYFQQLGVTDVGEIALWSGLSLGVTPAITALMSPLWGRLADRVGRKIMIERSLVSFVIVMAAMAFVTEAWHVFALRAIQGLFAGYGALALTMAADAAPRDRMAFAIGTVQTAQRIGPARRTNHWRDGRADRRSQAGVSGDGGVFSGGARARVHDVSRASSPRPQRRQGRRTNHVSQRSCARELRAAHRGRVWSAVRRSQFRSRAPALPGGDGDIDADGSDSVGHPVFDLGRSRRDRQPRRAGFAGARIALAP